MEPDDEVVGAQVAAGDVDGALDFGALQAL
jgi:hypothetical protein